MSAWMPVKWVTAWLSSVLLSQSYSPAPWLSFVSTKIGSYTRGCSTQQDVPRRGS